MSMLCAGRTRKCSAQAIQLGEPLTAWHHRPEALYDRIAITAQQKQWPVGNISQHLGRDLLVFVENVAAERLASDFAQRSYVALLTLG